MQSLTEQLAEHLQRPIGGAERARAKVHLRDWIACALLGAASPAGQALADYGRRQPAGPCTAFGAGARCANTAAFVNGGLGNIYELDDTHRTAVLHPGDTAIAAALAVAEREDAIAESLLDAIVRGYEATIRIGSAAGTGHYRHWYSTATCGVFGAATAAASILHLDARGLVHALGSAGMQFASVWQCRLEPSFGKQLATARAAQSGIVAAELTAAGFTAPREILEGPLGFFAATGADGDRLALAGAKDSAWKIWETSFKPWPACRATHPAIEAALIARSKIEPRAIREIEIEIFQQAIAMCDNPVPATPHEGRFSLQHCTAISLLYGVPKLGQFEPEWLRRADIQALRAKVSLRANEQLTAAFPARLGISMRVVTDDGDQARFELWTAKGDPENPMTEAELEQKATELMSAAGAREDKIRRILDVIQGLDGDRSIAPLTSALRALAGTKRGSSANRNQPVHRVAAG